MPSRRVPVQVLPGCRGFISVPELRRVARHVLAAEGVAAAVEAEVVLADAATVRDLNRLYRGKDEETDVLSFAQQELDGGAACEPAELGLGLATPVAFVEPPEQAPSLGEVIICAPFLQASARETGLPAEGEAAHLLVHGLLHLLGYDHETSEQDSQHMRRREDELLAALGYAGRYEHGH